jgi:hypothetical protein
MLNHSFFNFIAPHNYLSVDESTINFKGHEVFKMYNPKKPIYIHVVAHSTNGYVYDMIPYYGSKTTRSLVCKKYFTQSVFKQ